MRLVFGLMVLLGLSPYVVVGTLEDPANLPRFAFLEVLAPLVLGIHYLSAAGRARPAFGALPWLVAVLVGLAWLSIGWAGNRYDALVQAVHLLGMGVVFVLAREVAMRTTTGVLKWLIVVALIAVSGVAFIGLMQNFGRLTELYPQTVAPAGTMVHRNVLAQTLDCLAFPAIAILLTARGRAGLWAVALCLVLLSAMTLLSYCRGAWLGQSLALLAGLLLLARCAALRASLMAQWRRLPGDKWGVLALVVLIPPLLMQAPSPVTGEAMALKIRDTVEQPPNSNVAYREALYRNTLRMIADHPFGVGVGNWRTAYQAYHAAVRPTPYYGERIQTAQAHNDFLAFFAELGLLGGVLFMIILGLTVRRALAIVRDERCDAERRLLVFALLLGLLAVGLHALVSFPFHSPSAALLIWSWIGLIDGARPEQGSVERHPRRAAPVVGMLAVALALLATIYNDRYLTTDAMQARAQALFDAGQCREALPLIDTALEIFPAHYRARQRQALFHSHCDPDPGQALAIAAALSHDEPYYLNNLMNLMPLADRTGRLDLLETAARRLLTAYPRHPAGHHGMGILALRRGDLAAARRWFAQALAVSPAYAPSRRMLDRIE